MKSRILLVSLIALMLAACGQEEPETETVRPVLSLVVEPSHGKVQSFTGVVAARTETDHAFRVLGQMTARNVDIGDRVQQGDMLASLDPTSFALSVESARAGVASAEAARETASSNLVRQKKLYSANAASKASLEEASQAYEGATASLKQAQANLAKAEEQLSYTRLVAAFDGVVTDVSAEVGQTVSAGEPVVTLAKLGEQDVILDVPEADLATVAPGQRFETALLLGPDFTALGRVREIAPAADPITRTWRVKLTLEDPPAAYRLGSTVAATAMPLPDQRLAIPAKAVLSEKDGQRVWVVDPQSSTVRSKAVQTAPIPGSDSVAILSGIAPGTRIVTAGIHSLDEGQHVKIAEGADHE